MVTKTSKILYTDGLLPFQQASWSLLGSQIATFCSELFRNVDRLCETSMCVLNSWNMCVGGTLRFGEAFGSSKIGSCVKKIFIWFSVRIFEFRCENCTRNIRKRLYRWPAAIWGGILSHSGTPCGGSSNFKYWTFRWKEQIWTIWSVLKIAVDTLRSLWGHFGVTPGWLWIQFGINFGALWGHFEVVLGPFWCHFEVTLGSRWVILKSCGDHFGGFWGRIPN